MRKADPEAIAPQQVSAEEQELARVVPIRTETTLTRFPFHRIAKKGAVKIRQTKRNARGRVETTWEVRNPPGPLAYKLDTIIINRRIDEMRNRGEIRQLLKLGSLRDICQELGINASGKNTNAIKEALRENAFAGITAKIEFAGNDGTERTFEFNTTRYTVIFTGERLPDGKRADAVYIELHPRYHEMLRHSRTRPLDYEYLKELPPSAQRLYELLSFAMYGTLKHGRPNAQMLYSEFCASAPLTRYDEWDRVRPQMWKVHKPHIEAGYIKTVEFQETTDATGRCDWLIKYTPGGKARHEHREFKSKRIEDQTPKPARPRLVGTKDKGREERTTRTPEDAALIEKLMSYGVDEAQAARLVERDRVECELWATAWPHQNKKGMDNEPAVLKSFIEKKRRPLPKGYKDALAHEEHRRNHEEREQRRMASEFHFDYFAPIYRARLKEELSAIEQTHPDEYRAFRTHFEQTHAKSLRMMTGEELREGFTLQKAEEFFNELHPELQVRLITFDEWNATENGAADPLEWFKSNPQAIAELLK